MREHPILMSGPMVLAIFEDRKTQTRRIIKPQPIEGVYKYDGITPTFQWKNKIATCRPIWPDVMIPFCPYGQVGDRLWVRETWINNGGSQLLFRADFDPKSYEYGAKGWKPSIHMPRWASRLTLEITAVRVERLQAISLDDMRAEGVRPTCEASLLWRETLTGNFKALWDGINAKRGYSWAVNPWVWVVDYRRVL